MNRAERYRLKKRQPCPRCGKPMEGASKRCKVCYRAERIERLKEKPTQLRGDR